MPDRNDDKDRDAPASTLGTPQAPRMLDVHPLTPESVRSSLDWWEGHSVDRHHLIGAFAVPLAAELLDAWAERDSLRTRLQAAEAAYEALHEYHRSVVVPHAASVQTKRFDEFRAARDAWTATARASGDERSSGTPSGPESRGSTSGETQDGA